MQPASTLSASKLEITWSIWTSQVDGDHEADGRRRHHHTEGDGVCLLGVEVGVAAFEGVVLLGGVVVGEAVLGGGHAGQQALLQ
jgi:hypothetical protein